MSKEQKDFYKQLHHIIRLVDLLSSGKKTYKYEKEKAEELIAIKRGKLSLEEGSKMRDLYITLLNNIYEEKKLNYKPQEVNYNELDKIVMKEICNDTNK